MKHSEEYKCLSRNYFKHYLILILAIVVRLKKLYKIKNYAQKFNHNFPAHIRLYCGVQCFVRFPSNFLFEI